MKSFDSTALWQHETADAIVHAPYQGRNLRDASDVRVERTWEASTGSSMGARVYCIHVVCVCPTLSQSLARPGTTFSWPRLAAVTGEQHVEARDEAPCLISERKSHVITYGLMNLACRPNDSRVKEVRRLSRDDPQLPHFRFNPCDSMSLFLGVSTI